VDPSTCSPGNHLFPPLRQRLVDSGKANWPMFDEPEQTSSSIIRY
jgi:hypothetical protein